MASVVLLKKGQQASFLTYGEPNSRGKVMEYSGKVGINSTAEVSHFQNGYFYKIAANHKYSKPLEITLKGLG